MNYIEKKNVTNQVVEGKRQLKLCLERPGGGWIIGDGPVTALGRLREKALICMNVRDHGKQALPPWTRGIVQLAERAAVSGSYERNQAPDRGARPQARQVWGKASVPRVLDG